MLAIFSFAFARLTTRATSAVGDRRDSCFGMNFGLSVRLRKVAGMIAGAIGSRSCDDSSGSECYSL